MSSDIDIQPGLNVKHIFWFSNFHFCILDICKDLSWDSQKSLTCLLVSPSPRSHFHWVLCSLYLFPHCLNHLSNFHMSSFSIHWRLCRLTQKLGLLLQMHTRLVVLLCSVLWICSFCSHHGSKLWLNVLKIQPLLLRTLTFHIFPIYHKHCSWVFSYPLALRPTPQNATSYHLTSYCAYRNRDYYTLPRCGGWECWACWAYTWASVKWQDLTHWTFRVAQVQSKHKCLFSL